MAEPGLRIPGPLSFDGNVSQNWKDFEQDFRIYTRAALKGKDPDVISFTLLNLAGRDAVEREKTFVYQEGETKEDPETLMKKFRELCSPEKNVIMDRHHFMIRQQKHGESYEVFIADLKKLAAPCEFEQLKDGLILNKIVCGILSEPLKKTIA